ncbi:MAG: metallophosphoesterase [Deltaproteobacteria bacterium]|nr:metallophosphoesterase [Deltaproteobacteria bacterium]
MPQLIQRLPEGPLDVVGDVHGELDALLALLRRLGVDPDARTAERPVVFVGDLIDRGPDSVGVVELVAHLVEAGLAHAVVGNHELNLLAGDRKEGNGWFEGRTDDHAQFDGERRVFPSRVATSSERERIRAFLSELPLALERDDLRVVHASWDPDAAAKLPLEGDVARLADEWHRAIDAELEASGLRARASEERREFAGLRDQHCEPTRHLAAVAAVDCARQRANPVKLITSGAEVEVAQGKHFFVGGKWRFVTRDAWWRRPVDRPTVVGHYWRRRAAAIAGKLDLWGEYEPHAWAGDVFCVDYSVGRRFLERFRGRRRDFDGGLAALRFPERALVFDDRAAPVPTTR